MGLKSNVIDFYEDSHELSTTVQQQITDMFKGNYLQRDPAYAADKSRAESCVCTWRGRLSARTETRIHKVKLPVCFLPQLDRRSAPQSHRGSDLNVVMTVKDDSERLSNRFLVPSLSCSELLGGLEAIPAAIR